MDENREPMRMGKFLIRGKSIIRFIKFNRVIFY
jgi:hypothetical protein